MTPPRKGGGRDEEQNPRDDETQEYELGEDFLADGADDEERPEDVEPEELDDEDVDEEDLDEEDVDDAELEEDEYDEEDELEQVISAETQEWDGLEAAEAEGEEERTLASAGERMKRAGSAITSGFEKVGGKKVTGGFKAVRRRLRFPIWARFLTAILVIVGSVGTATAASLILYIGGIAEDLKLDPEFKSIQNRLEHVDGGDPQTILILGSDKRPEFKEGKFRGLSDTTMLLRVDPDRNAIALFSLPRDLQVSIPGYGIAKLNEAYFAGGPELTLRTIQDLTDVPSSPGGLEIHHLVNVDFEGFARAVNSIDCVYIDVDRRYFNTNDDFGEDYEEIDIQPGYQALCGFDALDYTRYRHTDNDVVRAARQQDFLREARQKVPPEVLFAERKELIKIFTEHTTSDIDDPQTMLQVLKLFIEARSAPVKEVHFEGHLGPSFVTTTPEEIELAVRQFLGIEDTPGARGDTAAPEDPSRVTPEEQAPDATGATPATPEAKTRKQNESDGVAAEPAELTETTFGRQLARGIRTRNIRLPVYYPTKLEVGTDYTQKPRVYKINGTGEGSPPNGERAAYKWVFSRPALGEYYGFMATRWKDPPILDNPTDEKTIGDRTYQLYYDGDRLRLVAWQTNEGSFWVSNTLIQSLSDREMIEIANGMTELPGSPGV